MSPHRMDVKVDRHRAKKAVELHDYDATENHEWRQESVHQPDPLREHPQPCGTASSAPATPPAGMPSTRRYWPSTIRISSIIRAPSSSTSVEQLLVEQMQAYFGCTEVETRVISGQMSNMATFSALMDWKNRLDRKRTPQRLGYVMNNHIIKGGHLSAQPMGALRDYIAIDPVTERHAIVNFPVCEDNIYKIDVEETKKLIDQLPA